MRWNEKKERTFLFRPRWECFVDTEKSTVSVRRQNEDKFYLQVEKGRNYRHHDRIEKIYSNRNSVMSNDIIQCICVSILCLRLIFESKISCTNGTTTYKLKVMMTKHQRNDENKSVIKCIDGPFGIHLFLLVAEPSILFDTAESQLWWCCCFNFSWNQSEWQVGIRKSRISRFSRFAFLSALILWP